MAILAWTLTGPVVALMLGMAWLYWASRERGPVDPRESTADYERFRSAMAAPLPRVPEARTPTARTAERTRR